jgi:predicted Zn finger-like uncharacterized protein
MSFVTQCPSCASLFQVVADQLRVSKGWVRCGVCGQAFEAQPHEDAAVAKAVLDPKELEPLASASATVPAPTEFAEATTLAPAHVPIPETSAQPVGLDLAATLQTPPLDTGSALADEPAFDDDSHAPPGPHTENMPKSLAERHAMRQPETASERATIGFVAQAKAAQAARRRRVWWALAAGLLALSLVAQWAVHNRHMLAARHSLLRAPLTMVCESLGCEVHAPQLPQSLLVDASQFSLVRSNLYKLTVVVRNSSNLAVQAPHLELTLTNFNDDASARRVLSPADLGLFAPNLAPQAEWTGSAVFRLGPGSLQADGKVAGYRVVAFYP